MSEIYATLFNDIISGKCQPETRLKEEDLARQFNISRTPVREALRQLEQDGLIQILPKRYTRVIGFTVDDVEEIYEIRKSLEQQAMSSSVYHLSIQGLKEIRTLVCEVAQSTDYKKHEQIDAQLHNYFIEASGKRRLIAILNQMCRLIQRFREMGFKDSKLRNMAAEDHIEIIDALCIRDIDKAVNFLGKHIERSKLNAISLLVKQVYFMDFD